MQVRALADLADAAQAEEQQAGVRQFPMLELAGSAHLGAAASSTRLVQADRVVQTLPLTLSLLGTGDLLVHQARVLITETAHCTPEVARRAEAAVLPDGAGLCPADLRKRLRKAVHRIESELDGEAVEQRLADARAERRTWTSPESDGMGVAAALLPAEQLRRWQLDLDQLERAERVADRQAGVERTSDLKREPGTVEGVGPVSAEHVRLLRPTGLRRILIEHATGRPIHVDDHVAPAEQEPTALREQVLDMLQPAVAKDVAEPQHDPSARLARLIDLRDLHCCGPAAAATTPTAITSSPTPPVPPPHGTSTCSPGAATPPSTTAGSPSVTPTAAPPGPARSAAATNDPHPMTRHPGSTPTASSHRYDHHRPDERPGGPIKAGHHRPTPAPLDHPPTRPAPRRTTTSHRSDEGDDEPPF